MRTKGVPTGYRNERKVKIQVILWRKGSNLCSALSGLIMLLDFPTDLILVMIRSVPCLLASTA